jgi:DNA polymerase III delta prime subunit
MDKRLHLWTVSVQQQRGLNMNIEQLLWVEKYRPATIDDCILPQSVKDQANNMVKAGNINHLLLSGPAGTGKTTLAKAICNELGADFIIYNGSDGSLNLDELRQNVADFAHTTSLNGNTQPKVIIIDEADGMNHLMQPALRNSMEKYARGCRFILTCNYPDKIIEPLHSRCASIDYKFDKSELNALVQQFARRCAGILKEEGITFEVEALKETVLKYFPDNRKILNELQAYANQNGCIDDGIMASMKSNVDILFNAIKEKDFNTAKQWVTDNSVDSFFNMMYKESEKRIDPALMPLMVLKLGEYQKHHGIVPNRELNALACLTEFMSES